jgi:hypothetical protein
MRAPLERVRGWFLGSAGIARVSFALALVVLVKHYFGALYHETEIPRGDGAYRPILAVQDGHMMYLHVLTVVFDRDLDITDEVARFGRTSVPYETRTLLSRAACLALGALLGACGDGDGGVECIDGLRVGLPLRSIVVQLLACLRASAGDVVPQRVAPARALTPAALPSPSVRS